MQVRKVGDRVRLFTRRGFDWTERYPWPIEAAARLKARSCTLDGELVVAGDDGIADFGKLHSRCFDGHAFLYAFDLIELDGEDLRRHPLIVRKDALAKLLDPKRGRKLGTGRGKGRDAWRGAEHGIRLCEHDDGDGAALFAAACRMGLEGIVSKRLDSFYRSGRSPSWLKVKNKRAPGFMRLQDGLEG